MRVNKAIEDGSFFENPALRSAFERGAQRAPARPRLVRRRPLAHRPPARAAAVRAREDVDPRVHGRAGRVADERRARPRGAAARPDRDRRRPLLRDGPRQALGANRSARSTRSCGEGYTLTHTQTSLRTCKRATTPASPTSSSSRSSVDGRRALAPGDTAVFFNFRPDRARQLSRRLLDARLRPDDDDALPRGPRLPRRVRRSRRRGHARRGAVAAHGLRQLHVAETEKYAHVTYFFNGGREEEWPGETRDPRPEPARRPELRPEAGDVGARGVGALLRRDRQGLRVRRRQLRQPGHGRPHRRRSPRRSRRSRRPTRASAQVVDAVTAAGGVCLVTADHGNAEQLLEADGVSPHTAHTTNPVPLVVTDRRSAAPGGRRARGSRARRRLRYLGARDRPEKVEPGEVFDLRSYTPASLVTGAT